jgi:hypothetical protein
MCSVVIRRGYAYELRDALVRHLIAGGGLVFVTVTLPHDVGDRLDGLFAAVADGWRNVTGCRAIAEFRAQNHFEFTRAAEVTYGQHGFHPHLHAILATETTLEHDERVALRDTIFDRWCSSMIASGYRPPSKRYGITLIGCDARKADYVTKVVGLADELTAQGNKTRGKTEPMFSVLRRAVAGDDAAARVWSEFELGTKGRRSLTFSRGFRKMLGMGGELSETEAFDVGRGSGELCGELRSYWADALARHPQGFEIFMTADDLATPEGWDAAVASLRGSLPLAIRQELDWLHYGTPADKVWEPVPMALAPDAVRIVTQGTLGELVEVGF